MLFTELALIRWITANNVYVTEATNFVLLASFLGIGIGFLNARSGRDYLRWTPLALLALVGFVLAFPVVLQVGPTPFRGVGHIAALPKPLSFIGVFVLTVAVMAGYGDRKSTRLNSSHVEISYAVFCLKKKTKKQKKFRK